MRFFTAYMLSLLMLALGARSLRAAPVPDALQVEMSHLAIDIAKIVSKHGGGSVAVGEFTGAADAVGHAGPGVQLALSKELEKAGLSLVTENHRFEVAGRYQLFHDTQENRIRSQDDPNSATGLNAVKLVAYLVDQQTGDFLAEKPTGRLIFGSEAVPALLGLNTSNPPLRDPRELSKRFGESDTKPQFKVSGTQIVGNTGQYAVELLVKHGKDYQARQVTLEKGHPFVKLDESDVYGVRLINNSPYEAAVSLHIDGVNCFAFSNSNAKYLVVPPHSHRVVYGWHRDDKTTTEFKVVANFPDTAAAKLNLKPSNSIGLITASFSASWEKEADRPDDEPAVKGRGTGFGEDIEIKTRQVTRFIGELRDNLTLRYER